MSSRVRQGDKLFESMISFLLFFFLEYIGSIIVAFRYQGILVLQKDTITTVSVKLVHGAICPNTSIHFLTP